MGLFRRRARAGADDADAPVAAAAAADDAPHETSFHTARFRRKRAVLVEVEPVAYKSIADEFRGLKDLEAFVAETETASPSLLLLDLAASSPAALVTDMVTRLVDCGKLDAAERDDAVRALVGSGFRSWILDAERQTIRDAAVAHDAAVDHQDPPTTLAYDHVKPDPAAPHDPALPPSASTATDPAVTSSPSVSDTAPDKPPPPPSAGLDRVFSSDSDHPPAHAGAAGPDAHWHQNIQGPSFIVAMGKMPPGSALKTRVCCLARLAHATNLGSVDHAPTRFVAVVLGPSSVEVKATKSVFEMARNLASLLSDGLFYLEATRAADEHEMRAAMRRFLDAEREIASESERKETAAEVEDLTGLTRTGKFAGGLIQDISRRSKVYLDDFVGGLNEPRSLLKYLSTIVWLFFVVIMPTIGLGSLNQTKTKGQIGVMEAIVAQMVGGIVFALFAGQPLVIVRTTGPISAYIAILVSWTKALNIEDDFLAFYAWTGIWTAVILVLVAVTDLSAFIKYVGSFTEQIFALLISAIFVGDFIKAMIDASNVMENRDAVLLKSLLLGFGTFLIAYRLMLWRRSFLLLPILRTLIADFGPPAAIIIMSGFNGLINGDSVRVETLDVPDTPGITTTTGRPWFVPLTDIAPGYIFLAIVPGFLVAILFFIDQNVSAILVNKPENRLKKPPGYHLDVFVVALLVLGTSLFGMPWIHGALPDSPMHARQLADVEEYETHGRRYERVLRARETRLTGLIAHVLVGLSILAKSVLGKIPVAVMYGFFLWFGIAALDGNQMWERTLLIFTQTTKYPPTHYIRRVPVRRVHLYTGVQIVLLVFLWFIKSNFYLGDTVFNTGVLFPFIIAGLVPVYRNIMPRVFTRRELSALAEEPIEDVSDEGITV